MPDILSKVSAAEHLYYHIILMGYPPDPPPAVLNRVFYSGMGYEKGQETTSLFVLFLHQAGSKQANQ